MSSEQRSSSAVRNLRSLFENKGTLDPNSPDTRGRSPGGVRGDAEDGGRPTSKVRASFVAVEPLAKMAAVMNGSSNGETKAETSSNGPTEGSVQADKTSGQEQEKLAAAASVVESTATTPSRKTQEPSLLDQDDSPLGQKSDKPPANPDKPVTATEEEPSGMKPADPTEEKAVSGGKALPPVAEDLRGAAKDAPQPAKKTEVKDAKTNGKPKSITTKPTSRPSMNALKSPSLPKSPPRTHAPPPTKELSKKASRSSLTAPTAASLARMGAGFSDKHEQSKHPVPPVPKKREVTKPVSLPSHLLAPTAASRAKHDSAPAPAATISSLRSSTTSRPKPAPSTKSAPRASLPPQNRPISQTSQHAAPRRSQAPPDGSFLERMMKPTAASASKVHDKVEAKTPPKTKAPAPKPKVNGSATKPAQKRTAAPSKTETAHHAEEDQHEETEAHIEAPAAENAAEEAPVDESSQIDPPKDEPTISEELPKGEEAGNATPLASIDNEPASATLEATPAAIGDEETIS